MKRTFVHKLIIMAAVALTYAANAANIGFVKGNAVTMGGFDAAWTNRLWSQGYTVTVFNDNTPANDSTLATMDLLLVSQSVSSGTYLGGPGIYQPKPILTYEYGIYDDIFGASGNGAISSRLTNGINIVSLPFPITAGLTNGMQIYTGEGGGGTISRFTSAGSNTIVFATSAQFTGSYIGALLPAGVWGSSNNIVFPAIRMAVPAYNTWDPNFVTAAGWQLLDDCVTYAISTIPEPGSLALIGLGLALFLARRHSR